MYTNVCTITYTINNSFRYLTLRAADISADALPGREWELSGRKVKRPIRRGVILKPRAFTIGARGLARGDFAFTPRQILPSS